MYLHPSSLNSRKDKNLDLIFDMEIENAISNTTYLGI
jgi:hypothetical protein